MDYQLVQSTLDDIEKEINDLQINVLFGFSQGGNVVDTFLVNRINQISCAVILAGYNLVDPNREMVDTPVLNVCSDLDEIVPTKFMPVYKNMVVQKHNKGHKIPSSKPFLREIVKFIYEHGSPSIYRARHIEEIYKNAGALVVALW